MSGRVAKAIKAEIMSKVQAGAGVTELAEQYAVSANQTTVFTFGVLDNDNESHFKPTFLSEKIMVSGELLPDVHQPVLQAVVEVLRPDTVLSQEHLCGAWANVF